MTTAFTLKRAPSNLLKWHHIRYDMGMLKPYCLFLKFGYMRHMFDILKVPNQISATLLRLFQKVWYSSITTLKQNCLPQRTVWFWRKCFLQKGEWEDSATRRDNSIFIIRSKERNLGSDFRVSYCDWYKSLYMRCRDFDRTCSWTT